MPTTPYNKVFITAGQGPGGSVTLGTVTTGAPGSDVVITNTGTSGAAILNFTIPRGVGVAAGGTTGQVLHKISNTNYATGWLTLAAVAISGSYDDLSDTPAPFALSIATDSVLGGIKTSPDILVDGGSGVATINASYGGNRGDDSDKLVRFGGNGGISLSDYFEITPSDPSVGGVLVAYHEGNDAGFFFARDSHSVDLLFPVLTGSWEQYFPDKSGTLAMLSDIVQADWNQTDGDYPNFIQNKPTLGTAAAANLSLGGNGEDDNGKVVEYHDDGSITVSGQTTVLDSGRSATFGTLSLTFTNNGDTAVLAVPYPLSDPWVWQLPDKGGTVAMTSDIPVTSSGGAGSSDNGKVPTYNATGGLVSTGTIQIFDSEGNPYKITITALADAGDLDIQLPTQSGTLARLADITAQSQADWTQADSDAGDFIKNKPTLGSSSSMDAGTGGNGAADAGKVAKYGVNGEVSVSTSISVYDTTSIDSVSSLTPTGVAWYFSPTASSSLTADQSGVWAYILPAKSGTFALTSDLPSAATSSVLGTVRNGTGLTNTSGVLSVTYGTTSGTAAQGNDSRLDLAATAHAATSKATPVDADEVPLVDSAASNVLKKLTWANAKATLKTYFDTIYTLTNLGGVPTSRTVNGQALTTNITISAGHSLSGCNLVVEGDSKSAEYGNSTTVSGANNSWYYQFMNLADASGVTGFNYALNGRTLSAITAAYASEAYTKRPSVTGKTTYLSIRTGANDLSSDMSTFLTNLLAHWATLRSDGFLVVAWTITITAGYGNSAATIAEINRVNQVIRDSAHLWDYLIDADASIPNAPSSGTNTWWTDTTHENATGNKIHAYLFASTLTQRPTPYALLGDIAKQTATNVQLLGGTIDNITIGQTTRAVGNFTTVSATATANLSGGVTTGASGNLTVGGTTYCVDISSTGVISCTRTYTAGAPGQNIATITSATHFPGVNTGATYLYDTTSNAIAVTLPSASGHKCIQTFKRISGGANNVVLTAGSGFIDHAGQVTYTLTVQDQFVTMQSNGTNWYIIAKG